MTVQGLHLQLIKNRQGKANWQHSNAQPQKVSSDTTTTKPATVKKHHENFSGSLSIPSIDLNDMNLNYQDQQKGQQFIVQHLNVNAKNIAPNRTFPIHIAFQLQNNQQQTAFDLKGKCRFGSNKMTFTSGVLQFSNTKNKTTRSLYLSNITITAISANNQIIIKPITFDAYKGNVSADATINSANQTSMAMHATINQVQLKPLLSDLNVTKNMSGILNANTTITTQGNSNKALTRNMNGQGSLSVTQGLFHGTDLGFDYRQALAIIHHKSIAKSADTHSTKIGNLSSKFVIQNGIMKLQSMNMTSPVVTANGAGTVNLNSQTMKINVDITGVRGSLEDLKKNTPTIPFTISGSFDNYSIRPNLDKLIKTTVTEQLKTNINKQLKKIGQIDLNKIF